MQLSNVVAAFAALAVGASAAAIERRADIVRRDYYDPADPDFIFRMLLVHNWARSYRWNSTTGETTPKLTWDQDLANAAKVYAETCKSSSSISLGEHDTSISLNQYGENLAQEAFATDPGYLVLYDWVWNGNWGGPLPTAYIDPQRVSDYTNVVWKSAEKVGCGFAACNGGDTALVCRYSPAPAMVNTVGNTQIKANVLPYQTNPAYFP